MVLSWQCRIQHQLVPFLCGPTVHIKKYPLHRLLRETSGWREFANAVWLAIRFRVAINNMGGNNENETCKLGPGRGGCGCVQFNGFGRGL